MGTSLGSDGRRVSEPNGQLRFFKGTTLVLVFLLLGAVGYYEYRQHTAQPVNVLVDGTTVTTVQDLTTAKQLIQQVHSEQVGSAYDAQDNPHFVEDVEFQRTTSDAPIDSLDAASVKLSAATHTVVTADVIVVNQKPLVALPDLATAQAAVDAVRDHYSSLPPNDPVDGKPTFVQVVTIDRRTVPASLAKPDALSAAQLLWTPPQPQTYTVQNGETGWLIARKFGLSFSDFLRANNGTDVNKLVPGDTVVVSRTFPPIDVVVVKTEQVNQSFGGTGMRQLTLQATYVDGVLTGTPIATNMITLQRAKPLAELY